jgi:predicted nucleic acid-binding protein
MIFLEISFIVNFHVSKIQNHEKARKIYEKIEDKPKYISEMVIYETLTVLRKLKQNDTKLKEVHDFLINSDIKVLEDIIFYEKALELTFNNLLVFLIILAMLL